MMGIKHFGTDNCLTTSGILQELYQTQRLYTQLEILNRHQCKHSQDTVDKIIYVQKN